MTDAADTAPARHVLLTGASGFLGTHLCAALRARSYVVHTLSRRAPPPPDGDTDARSTVHHACDLTDDAASATLQRILREREWHAVVHLAGLISYTSRDAAAMHRVNVDATAKLLDAVAAHARATRVVYCSSVAAVGSNASPAHPPLTEESAWDDSLASVAYVRTKREAEVLVRDAARAHGLRTVSLCPSNVFGRGDAAKSSRKTHVRAAGGHGRIYTNGGVSIVHVGVVVRAFLAAVDADASDPIYNGSRWLLTGDNVSVREMLRLCAEAGGNADRAPWLRLPDWLLMAVCFVMERLGSKSMAMDRFTVATRFHWFDGSAARKRFDLPVVPARDAIADSVAWMREQGMVKPRT